MREQPSNPVTYLVTGASGTIGSAVVRRLARPGVTIGLQYCNNLAAVESLRDSLESVGVRCVSLQSSLDSEESCRLLVEQTVSAIWIPDGIAICQGRVPWQKWQNLSCSDWQNAVFEHCVVPFTLTRLAIPRMLERSGGRVAYLSSIAAKYGGSSRTLHYAAAKAGLETAMRGLARETASSGLRINGVRAGFVMTPQHEVGRTPAEIVDRIRKIPMGRAGRAEEVAAAMAFLLSEEASFVTGEIITVAGGD